MIILRNVETFERIPYTEVVGPHTYRGHGGKVAFVKLEDGREFPLEHGETLKIMEGNKMQEWEVFSF